MKRLPTDRWCYLFDPEVPFDRQLNKLKQLYPYKEQWENFCGEEELKATHRSYEGLNITLGYCDGYIELTYGNRHNVNCLLRRHPDFPVKYWEDLNLGIRSELTT